MYNKVILVGNLTRDVELRYLPSGAAVARLGLATNRRYKKQDGTQAEEVCYIDANLFGRTAEVANQYLKKGSQVLIEGRLTLESWVDNTGAKRSKHSITAESMQMLGQRQNASENGNYGGAAHGAYGEGGQGSEYSSGEYASNRHSNDGYSNYSGNQESYAKSAPQAKPQKEPELPVIDINDDEIPF